MKLDDSVIAHIAKLVQIAILTGTDVVDHMRMVKLSESDNMLFLDPEYQDVAENNIKKMLQQAEEFVTGE
jgi:hypothetical protein